jgi:hypothetical protein
MILCTVVNRTEIMNIFWKAFVVIRFFIFLFLSLFNYLSLSRSFSNHNDCGVLEAGCRVSRILFYVSLCYTDVDCNGKW